MPCLWPKLFFLVERMEGGDLCKIKGSNSSCADMKLPKTHSSRLCTHHPWEILMESKQLLRGITNKCPYSSKCRGYILIWVFFQIPNFFSRPKKKNNWKSLSCSVSNKLYIIKLSEHLLIADCWLLKVNIFVLASLKLTMEIPKFQTGPVHYTNMKSVLTLTKTINIELHHYLF